MTKNNLPIQMIMSRKRDTAPNTGGGSDKLFCEITEDLTKQLISDVESIEEYCKNYDSYQKGIPAAAKIVMKPKAEAKSHKPNRFCHNGLNIIGAETFGEILVKVTPSGIEKTIEELTSLPSEKYKANISAISEIVPYTKSDILPKSGYANIMKELGDNGIVKLKLTTFNFEDDLENAEAELYLAEHLGSILLNKIDYLNNLNIYKVKIESKEQLDLLLNMSFVKSVDVMPMYGAIPIMQANKLMEKITSLQDPVIGGSHIGIIDGGICEENTLVNRMVTAREIYVPKEYQDRRHGTFIAGTILHGDLLNDIENPNMIQYKLVDIVAMPNTDRTYGATDTLSEEQLIDIIVSAMEKYSDTVKIWNLSLNLVGCQCNDSEVTDLAVFLDGIQDKYKVQFIVSSGNYTEVPIRRWPVVKELSRDRVLSPADSVRAISVGSIALKDDMDTIVKTGEPSSFSRRGPGANHIVKPDFIDYGGNVRESGSCKGVGVVSTGVGKGLVESIGTSFAAPRVAKKLAMICDETVNADMLLSKALLVHSARFSQVGRNKKSEETKYFGYGHPPNDIADITKCSQDKVTVIIDQVIKSGTHLEIYDFPYPKSLLSSGKWTGEITMTVLYEPELDRQYGSEYCRSNVEVSLGTYKSNENGEVIFKGQVPLETNWDSRYEKARVENGFKWSPIKCYHRKLSRLDPNSWKLRVSYSPRNEAVITQQRVILIITIEDPKGQDIYSDVISQLNLSGFVYNELKLRSQTQTRSQGENKQSEAS